MAQLDLRYHSEALELLEVEPRLDSDALVRIEEAEQECRRRLPAAVREWYTLVGAEELLTLDNNTCGVTYLDGILEEFVQGKRKIEFYGPRRVNTGYQAYVVIDGSDDPPVDADGDPEPLSFSRFVLRLARYSVTGEYE